MAVMSIHLPQRMRKLVTLESAAMWEEDAIATESIESEASGTSRTP